MLTLGICLRHRRYRKPGMHLANTFGWTSDAFSFYFLIAVLFLLWILTQKGVLTSISPEFSGLAIWWVLKYIYRVKECLLKEKTSMNEYY